ncbi:TPA: hypothetical protein JG843_001714 [Vibrio parahaemolyticus]|nr:hypothetical protein [Vibrio parahaemolyticus]HAV1980596.1 hypothetical protein [Vibrio parahaemolyticus]
MDNLHQKQVLRGKKSALLKGQVLWTPEQDKQLSDFYAQGHTYSEIASLMGRTYHSVKGRGNKLCLHHKHPRRHFFTREEDKYVKSNYGLLPVFHIAAHLGLKEYQIYNRANLLGLSSERRYMNQNHHFSSISDEDVELIRQLHDEGLPQNLIAEKMEIGLNSVHSVVNYYSRLNLTFKH